MHQEAFGGLAPLGPTGRLNMPPDIFRFQREGPREEREKEKRGGDKGVKGRGKEEGRGNEGKGGERKEKEDNRSRSCPPLEKSRGGPWAT